jgi:hypothetical protein
MACLAESVRSILGKSLNMAGCFARFSVTLLAITLLVVLVRAMWEVDPVLEFERLRVFSGNRGCSCEKNCQT